MDPRRRGEGLRLLTAAVGVALLAASCSGGEADEKVWSEAAYDDEAIAEMMGECLDEAGVPHSTDADGGVFIRDVPKAKWSAGEILDDCNSRLVNAGLIPDPDVPPGSAELDLIHEAWTETVV